MLCAHHSSHQISWRKVSCLHFLVVLSNVRSQSLRWCHLLRPLRSDTANIKTPTTTWFMLLMSHRLCTTCYSRLAWWWVRHGQVREHNVIHIHTYSNLLKRNKQKKPNKNCWPSWFSSKKAGSLDLSLVCESEGILSTWYSEHLCQPNCSFAWHSAFKYGFFLAWRIHEPSF